MKKLLVSQPLFCTHDIAVNNLTWGARKVGPLKQQVQFTQKELYLLWLSSHSLRSALQSGFHILCFHRIVYQSVLSSIRQPPGTTVSNWCQFAPGKELLGWTESLFVPFSISYNGGTSEETESTLWRHQAQKGELFIGPCLFNWMDYEVLLKIRSFWYPKFLFKWLFYAIAVLTVA